MKDYQMILHANKVQNMITAKEAQQLSQQSKNIKDQEKEKATERLLQSIYQEIAEAASKGRTSYSRVLKPNSYCKHMLQQDLEAKGFTVWISATLASYSLDKRIRGVTLNEHSGYGLTEEISIEW